MGKDIKIEFHVNKNDSSKYKLNSYRAKEIFQESTIGFDVPTIKYIEKRSYVYTNPINFEVIEITSYGFLLTPSHHNFDYIAGVLRDIGINHGIVTINPFKFGSYISLKKWCEYHESGVDGIVVHGTPWMDYDVNTDTNNQGNSNRNVVSQKTIIDIPKEDIYYTILNLEDEKITRLEELDEWFSNKRKEFVEIGGGKWKTTEDTISMLKIRMRFGYTEYYPHYLIDDDGKMLVNRTSIRRLSNIINVLENRVNAINDSFIVIQEDIEKCDCVRKLHKINFEDYVNIIDDKQPTNNYVWDSSYALISMYKLREKERPEPPKRPEPPSPTITMR